MFAGARAEPARLFVPPTAPEPPFAEWPLQRFDPLVGFYWYASPAVLVSQTVAVHGSLEVIERNNDVVDFILDAKADDIRSAGGLFVFNDWRSVKSYDQDARARQRVRMRARPSGYARRTVIVVNPASRLLRMAVEAANLFATLTLRSRIEVELDAARTFARAGIEPPRKGALFPVEARSSTRDRHALAHRTE